MNFAWVELNRKLLTTDRERFMASSSFMGLPLRQRVRRDRQANVHAVAPHFPHDFSAELMSHGGADEEAPETTPLTRLRNVGPSPFLPIYVKPSLVFRALNVDPALPEPTTLHTWPR